MWRVRCVFSLVPFFDDNDGDGERRRRQRYLPFILLQRTNTLTKYHFIFLELVSFGERVCECVSVCFYCIEKNVNRLFHPNFFPSSSVVIFTFITCNSFIISIYQKHEQFFFSFSTFPLPSPLPYLLLLLLSVCHHFQLL